MLMTNEGWCDAPTAAKAALASLQAESKAESSLSLGESQLRLRTQVHSLAHVLCPCVKLVSQVFLSVQQRAVAMRKL